MQYILIATSLLFIAILLEYIFREKLFHSLKERIIWAMILLIVGTIWDTYAVINNHWVFPGNGVIGINIGIVPLEEYLWFLIVPYFCLTVYKTTHIIFDKRRTWKKH